MSVEAAVAAPRIHHQWLPDEIALEEGGVSPGTMAALEEMGHAVSVDGAQGQAHVIVMNPVTGERIGAPDPRSPDAAAAGH